ncbi:RtcB family protein [Neisseria sp. 20925_1_37]
MLDVHHNFLEQTEINGTTGWLHRKGATPTDKGLIMILGSRGECKGRLSHKYTADSLRQTEFGSVVVCQDKALIFEEAPQAYKSIDSVIAAMKNVGLIELVARFKPVLTYKTGGECGA